MAFLSAQGSSLSIGAINTDASKSTTHNFPASNIYAYPVLQKMFWYDDEGHVETFVSKFVDGAGTHNVDWIGVFANNCTSVTFRLKVEEGYGRVHCITNFLS